MKSRFAFNAAFVLSTVGLLFLAGCNSKPAEKTSCVVRLNDAFEKLLEERNDVVAENKKAESFADLATSDAVIKRVAESYIAAFDSDEIDEIVAQLKSEFELSPIEDRSREYRLLVNTKPNAFGVSLLQGWVEQISHELREPVIRASFEATFQETRQQIKEAEEAIAQNIEKLADRKLADSISNDNDWKKMQLAINEIMSKQMREHSAFSRNGNVVEEVDSYFEGGTNDKNKEGSNDADEIQSNPLSDEDIVLLHKIRESLGRRSMLAEAEEVYRSKTVRQATGYNYNGKPILIVRSRPSNAGISAKDIEDFRARKARCPELPDIEFARR